jgi:CSLREA domain-containing protein
MRRVALLTGLLLCLAPAAASAATISPDVFTDDFTPNADCSLREAIQVANNNNAAVEDDCAVTGTLNGSDTVQLATGTYELDITGVLADNTNGEGDLDVTSDTDFTLAGTSAGLTTIDTDDSPAFNDRVLHGVFSSTALTVSDLSIIDGTAGLDASGGGGILAAGPLTLTRARVVLNSTTSSGGGVHVDSGDFTMTESLVGFNTVLDPGESGGGIQLSSVGNASIDDSVIRNNTIADPGNPAGAGIQASSSTVTITDSVLFTNSASDTDASGQATGGALDLVGSTATVRGSTLSGNGVFGGGARFGGAIRTTSSQLNLINSTVSGNQAPGLGGNGGGVALTGNSTSTIAHTTFGPNTVGTGGAAIYHDNSTTSVRGSLVETSGALPACTALGGTFTSLDDNVVTDTSCFAETGNDDTDADLMLGALADNGGAAPGPQSFTVPLETHLFPQAATQVDHVPAADCDDHPTGALTVDERGFDRPNDGDGNNVAACEAGALELQVPSPPVVNDSDPDSGADENEPEIKGTADAGTNVTLYADSACTGAVVGAGSDTLFATPGFTVTVPDNSSTTFFATATGAEGVSACSPTGFTYNEATPVATPPLTPPATGNTPTTPTTPTTPKKCKKGQKLKKGKCVKKKRRKK